MFTTGEIIFVLLIVGAVFLFLARRILRIALKLAFAMAILFVVVVGAGYGWWQGWFTGTPSSSVTHPPTASATPRANTNRTRR